MQRNLALTFVAGLTLLTMSIMGCSQQKTATAQDAIQQSETKATVQEKVDYLVAQANNFINGKRFEDGMTVAQHILQKLDANSQEAKNILERAKEELTKAAQQKVDEVRGNLTNKINALGK